MGEFQRWEDYCSNEGYDKANPVRVSICNAQGIVERISGFAADTNSEWTSTSDKDKGSFRFDLGRLRRAVVGQLETLDRSR